jgi:hypothetical protein
VGEGGHQLFELRPVRRSAPVIFLGNTFSHPAASQLGKLAGEVLGVGREGPVTLIEAFDGHRWDSPKN